MSNAYVGVDGTDTTVPGIVVIKKTGQIAFRQIASAKDDRLTAAQLLAQVDRTLGTGAGAPGARTGYAVLERLQLRYEMGAGLGERRTGDRLAVFAAAASVMFPVGRHVLVGPVIRYEPFEAPLDLDAAVTLRIPMLWDAGAFQITALGGYTPWGASGLNGGLRAGLWVALNPRWALHLDGGITAHRLSDDRLLEGTAMFGVSRLIQIR